MIASVAGEDPEGTSVLVTDPRSLAEKEEGPEGKGKNRPLGGSHMGKLWERDFTNRSPEMKRPEPPKRLRLKKSGFGGLEPSCPLGILIGSGEV